MDLIKVRSIKGMPSELIFLTNDVFMLRVPPSKLLEDPINRGLPTKCEIKYFFKDYHPTEEDNIKILEVLINPQVFEVVRLLRMMISTKDDLDKLRKKGVDNISGVLKILWDCKMIKVLHDKKNKEYYALLTDFYIDFIFPKYLLKNAKSTYEQKSKVNKVLIEYLNVLEESFLTLKSPKKSKETKKSEENHIII